MADYRIRPATVYDADALVHHRIAMFPDMGVPLDASALEAAFRRWLTEMMPKGLSMGYSVAPSPMMFLALE